MKVREYVERQVCDRCPQSRKRDAVETASIRLASRRGPVRLDLCAEHLEPVRRLLNGRRARGVKKVHCVKCGRGIDPRGIKKHLAAHAREARREAAAKRASARKEA